MNAIDIDFAPPGIRRAMRRMKPWAYLAIAAGIALGAWSALRAQELLDRIAVEGAAAHRAAASLNRRVHAKPVTEKIAIGETEADAVNTAVAQLNIPWRDLFDAVESATPKEIALLSLDPDAGKHILRGTAEAKSGDDMVAYIEQLKKPGFFDVVVLTRHEVNEQDPNKPLRFQFEAHWQGEAP
jgi:hypothetical protein